MKKFALVGIVVAATVGLTACGGGNSSSYSDEGYAPNGGGYTDTDWDLDHPSIYNNNTYCNKGTYTPQPNGFYTCTNNGVTSQPSKRPTPIIPPKSQQKAPAKPAAPAAPKQNNTAPKQNNTAPKAPAQAPKAPPAAPKAPAPPAKSGK